MHGNAPEPLHDIVPMEVHTWRKDENPAHVFPLERQNLVVLVVLVVVVVVVVVVLVVVVVVVDVYFQITRRYP